MDIFTIFPPWLLTTILVLLMFCIFIYTLMNKSSIYVPKLPPSPPKLPIIGNLHQILGKSRHEILWELSKKYGPIMQIHIGSKPFLVISSPTMAKQILKTQDHIFCSRQTSRATKRLTYNYLDVAFSPHDKHWKEMRKVFVSELLAGPRRAKMLNHVLVLETESMISSLSLHPSNVAINLNKVLFETIKGVICKIAFGDNYRQLPLIGPSWEEMLDETNTMLGGSIGDTFPWLGHFIDQLSGWNGKLEKCFSYIDAYIENVISDHHKQTIGELSDDNKDFVHTLIELCSNHNSSGYQLTKEDMKALIMDVLTGGIDTTVVTLVWAMSEIIRNTRVMHKLQSEIRDQMNGSKKVEALDMTKMSYLHMVIKETLRMHEPAPLLIPHESISHCQIGGYDVFPGTSALINAWGISRDPTVWGENADEFYPERFEKFEASDFEMVPFGGGRRTCPAINTAPIIVEFVIANLLFWFDWELPNGEKNEDLNMEEKGTSVLRKKFPLWLVLTKNNEKMTSI
uniref:parthenolide synthase-like n=1 Tax=Erigeron canadensis TaxID=72917 RepID=UPI001CB97D04|nr:parthenolide synthase-like [Erigeron canadensis]